MGLESINYHFVPNKSKANNLEGILQEQGANIQQGKFGVALKQFVIKENNKFWIDILLGKFDNLDFPSISIRIALCNPPAVLNKMEELFKSLFLNAEGYLVDISNKREFTSLSENERIEFETLFLKKQKKFFEDFGNFSAAISGDDVFDYIRNNL